MRVCDCRQFCISISHRSFYDALLEMLLLFSFPRVYHCLPPYLVSTWIYLVPARFRINLVEVHPRAFGQNSEFGTIIISNQYPLNVELYGMSSNKLKVNQDGPTTSRIDPNILKVFTVVSLCMIIGVVYPPLAILGLISVWAMTYSNQFFPANF